MTTFITCKRCEGKGRLAHFGHRMNGVCLDCKGAGKVVKTKRVKIAVQYYTVVCAELGTRIQCGEDKASADSHLAKILGYGCAAHIETREVTKTQAVPV